MSSKKVLYLRVDPEIKKQIELDKAKQPGLSESNIAENIFRQYYLEKAHEKANTSMKMLVQKINQSNENLNENLKEIIKIQTENQYMLKQLVEEI